MKVTIVGGGIIGLSSALYLHRAGAEVTVIDKSDFLDNCSYGNAGYICPSHFIPLASPGVVKQGIKWMFDSTSPFYVQPRLDWNLINWAWKFSKHATKANVNQAAVPLKDIAVLSKAEYSKWETELGMNFNFSKKGLLEIFQTDAAAEHAHHTLEKAWELGLSDTKLLTKEELELMEPGIAMNSIGALYFGCDTHCYPNKLMGELLNYLKQNGVTLKSFTELTGVTTNGNKIQAVQTNKDEINTDELVFATGSWGRQTASLVGLDISLMPGRGYSVTMPASNLPVQHPAILVEGRVALTPLGDGQIRIGGTMEVTSHKTPPRFNRVEGIIKAVNRYYPNASLKMPPKENIWYGYRPCSMDGLPYIGRTNKWSNLTIATGHSMLGLSLGAATGKLVSELVLHQPTSMDLAPFSPHRS